MQNCPWDCNATPWVPHICRCNVLQKERNIEYHMKRSARSNEAIKLQQDTVQNL